jgi:SAM-dependent methyltransferase
MLAKKQKGLIGMPSASRTVLSLAKRTVARLLGHRPIDNQVDKLYEGNDFLESYIAHTNKRVAEDPKAAIGGMWDEIGALQYDFLKRVGLEPTHRMLDIGCGTLRGGRHFIRYLDVSNYTGIDISPACIVAANELLVDEQLSDKKPRLILVTSKNITFSELEGNSYDYIFAQSVLTHLPASLIREFFENIGKCMLETSNFYFTYFPAEENSRIDHKDFAYPWSFFAELARDHGFEAEEVSHLYPHPRGQKMGRVSKL